VDRTAKLLLAWAAILTKDVPSTVFQSTHSFMDLSVNQSMTLNARPIAEIDTEMSDFDENDFF
jgi:hypothetical protein